MNYDVRTVDRVNMDLFAQDTGAEFADVTGFDAAIGDSPTDVAMAASRLGLRTVPFTAVGTDTVGDFVLREDWYHSCRVGTACGATSVTEHGCTVAFPTPDELAHFVESYGGL